MGPKDDAPRVVAKGVNVSDWHQLELEGAWVYFYMSIPRSFRRVPKKGGEVEVIDGAGFHFRGWDVDADDLYWGKGWATIGAGQEKRTRGGRTWTTSGHKEGEGGVMRVSTKGGTSKNLCEGCGKVEGIVVDETSIFWLDADSGEISRMKK